MKRGECFLDSNAYAKMEKMERLMEKLVYLLGNCHSSIHLLEQRIRRLETSQSLSDPIVFLSRKNEGKMERSLKK
ncbi:hypothetical protein [Bacillus smithii]|uniref:hypothetical protein n=1 Tax=Bacillus smithii TaxID=1479 RepID=UPI0030C946E6